MGGVFVRFNYWYDDVLENEAFAHGHTGTNYFPNARLDSDALMTIRKVKASTYLMRFTIHSLT